MRIGIGIGIGAGGGASPLPTTFTDISGLRIDYDAERETSSTQVTDFSGNGYHATQADASKRPSRSATGFGTNSKAYWQGAVSKFWLPAPAAISGLTALTVVYVLQGSGVSSGGVGKWGSSGLASETPFSSVVYDDAGSTTRNQSSNIGTTFSDSPVVFMVFSTGTEHTFKRGSTQIFTTGTNTVGMSTAPVLGAGGPYNSGTNVSSSYFTGKYARVLVFNKKLSADEQTTVLARLNAIYGTS